MGYTKFVSQTVGEKIRVIKKFRGKVIKLDQIIKPRKNTIKDL